MNISSQYHGNIDSQIYNLWASYDAKTKNALYISSKQYDCELK